MFNILVAEDDASACRLMCEVLRQAGYQPPCPGRGAGTRADGAPHIDLAVVDLTMPQMDGLTFTRTVREGGSSLPILMVTARVAQADKREASAPGRTTIWSSPSTRRRCSGASRRCCADRAVPPSPAADRRRDGARLPRHVRDLRRKARAALGEGVPAAL